MICGGESYVYTLGYPMVPCAQADLVGHRGEVNAPPFLGGSDILLISNLVSAGTLARAVRQTSVTG
jgi:hypothetical protein